MLRNPAEAEDAVQEICLKLWNMRDRLHELNSLEAFSMKTLKNWCLDRMKANKPVYGDRYDSGIEKLYAQDDPHKSLESADMLAYFQKLLESLPVKQRSIFQLRDLEGFEYEEIAEIMDMNINAVRVNVSRARTKLREELKKTRLYG